MDLMPIGLTKIDGGRAIDVRWSDGQEQKLTARLLRDRCPCATCREKQAAQKKKAASGIRQLQILSEAEMQPLIVSGMTPAGSYAYNISFSDGHHSGVYTLELLRSLSSQATENSQS